MEVVDFNKHEKTLRLKKPGNIDAWRFPKSHEWRNIEKVNDYLFWAESNGILITIQGVKKAIIEIIKSRASKHGKRSDPQYLISCMLFLGLIKISEITLEKLKHVNITLLGKIYLSLKKSVTEASDQAKESKSENKKLLLFAYFLMFWNSHFGCGATATSSRLDGVHPIRCLLKCLAENKKLTYEQICTRFYGLSDQQDFLSDTRAPIASTSPFVLWEYPYAMLKRSRLVWGDKILGLRHFKQKNYTPNAVVRPAELLEIFIKNQSEWKEKLAAWWLGNSSGVKAQFDYSLLLASQSEAPLYAGSLQSLLQLRERQSTVIERTYQKEFRDALMKEYGHACLVCGIKEIKVLEAAHIVSVSEIYDKFKKIQDRKILEDVANPFNGLILCANHHMALDSGILKILQIDSGECIWVLESKDQVMLESIKEKSFKNVHAKRLEFINKKINNEN